jgi:histone-lysine N-methyltransferase SETMAR
MTSRVSDEDDECSGWPSTSKTTENDVDKIWELTHKDCHRTIHELTDTAGISYGVCQEILTENLNMRCTAAKFVPLLLTNYQKQWSVNVCLELREKANKDPTFIFRIVNGWRKLDLWLWSRNKATIITVEQPTITKTKKGAAGSQFNKEHAHRFLLFFFFNVKGTVPREFVPPNTLVNSDFYCEVSRCLRENMWWKRPELWCNHNWLVPSSEFVTNNMVIVPHHPYSPDLAPCDFALFPELKMNLKVWHFEKGVWQLKGTASGTRQHWGKWLPWSFWSMEKNDATTVYVSKVTILKEMSAKIVKVMPAFIFLFSQGTFR